jgi:hypothetical protein
MCDPGRTYCMHACMHACIYLQLNKQGYLATYCIGLCVQSIAMFVSIHIVSYVLVCNNNHKMNRNLGN